MPTFFLNPNLNYFAPKQIQIQTVVPRHTRGHSKGVHEGKFADSSMQMQLIVRFTKCSVKCGGGHREEPAVTLLLVPYCLFIKL